MMGEYVARRLDELGRIVLPSEMRKRLGFGVGDTLHLYYVDQNTLILQRPWRPLEPACIFFDGTERQISTEDKTIQLESEEERQK